MGWLKAEDGRDIVVVAFWSHFTYCGHRAVSPLKKAYVPMYDKSDSESMI